MTIYPICPDSLDIDMARGSGQVLLDSPTRECSPQFRQLSPGVQEALSGTRYGTLRDVYDEIGPEDIRAEMRAVSGGS